MVSLRKCIYGGIATAIILASPKCYVKTLKSIATDCAKSSPKIRSQTELIAETQRIREDLKAEKDLEIEIYFYTPDKWKEFLETYNLEEGEFNKRGNGAKKIGNKTHLIKFNKNSSVCSLEHELYHVIDGHTEDQEGRTLIGKKLREWLVYEPQAILYSAYGWRI